MDLLCETCREDVFPSFDTIIIQDEDDDYPSFEIETTKEALLISAFAGCNLCSLLYACVLDSEFEVGEERGMLRPQETFVVRVGFGWLRKFQRSRDALDLRRCWRNLKRFKGEQLRL